ncbi:DUF4232 domain-containing protein [Micromonospora narathiwatensis]|uniref:DUF4232 domain-containing protein n=1 Tax=Micromonospora narathiwatensis TaxID=299146 RepID=A0A1A9A824_9ACTN|nr:DUF4232 domain-containing protein [Micromonospora narathiwatensis]SBT52256.1 Protein of unknown function (DUF4232) [Micromonospora narathiwatensis]
MGMTARLGALAGTVLLAACTPVPTGTPVGGGDAPIRSTTATPDLAACPADGIRITALGVSAAMGLRAMGLDLVNCGTGPYALEGHPVPRLRGSIDLGNTGRLGVSAWKRDDRPAPTPSAPPPVPDSRR